jgi:hypothetical protein
MPIHLKKPAADTSVARTTKKHADSFEKTRWTTPSNINLSDVFVYIRAIVELESLFLLRSAAWCIYSHVGP